MSNREEVISFRMSSAEKQKLDEACRRFNVPRSRYLRDVMLSQAFPQKAVRYLTAEEEKRLEKRAVVEEINKIGVNINQIVHNVNSGFYSRSEKQRLFDGMSEIYALLGSVYGEGRDK